MMTKTDQLARRVIHADYSDEKSVTLTLNCEHKVTIEDFPRSQIPTCFRLNCKECAN